MPHRVTNFLRSSTQTFENPVTNLKKTVASAARRRDSPSRTERNSRSSERVFSYASSIEDDAEDSIGGAHANANPTIPQYPPPFRMSNHGSRSNSFSSDHKEKEKEQHHHRISFPSIHFGRSSKGDHGDHSANSHASLRWELESPPIVFYGDAENSSGALVSGQLFLDIKEVELEVESFNATLNIHVTQKKPFAPHCADCANQYTELKSWNFLQQPLSMAKGVHTFPFSVLLGGHLPASVDGQLVSIAYEVKAEAIFASASHAPIKFEKTLDVKRSLPPPEVPHHSVRVFPPTNIKASVHYPQVIHPIGSNTLQLRLDGIAKTNSKADTVEYWKLKKLTWRLEETAKTVAPACEKHAPKDPEPQQGAPTKKGVARTETRTIGEKTLFSGWKSSYVGGNGACVGDSCVEIELEYLLAKHARFSCDSKSKDGSEVSHQLMIEMVVSQEWAPVGKPSLVTQTGVGRILRMHFSTILTERGGIGISWDNEAPPIYQDVPPSPPAYTEETAYEGSVEEASIEAQPLDSPLLGQGMQRGSMDFGAQTLTAAQVR